MPENYPCCDCIETDKSADYSDAVKMNDIGYVGKEYPYSDGYGNAGVRSAHLYQCPACKRVEIA